MRCSCQSLPDIAVNFAYACGCGDDDCPSSAITWQYLLANVETYLSKTGATRSAVISFASRSPQGAEHATIDRQVRRVLRQSLKTGIAQRPTPTGAFRTVIVLNHSENH